LRMQTECPSRCARPVNKQGSLPPRKCTPAVNCGMFTLLVVQQWCDRRDVRRSFRWKRLSCYEVLFISPRTCMIGGKKACRAETVCPPICCRERQMDRDRDHNESSVR